MNKYIVVGGLGGHLLTYSVKISLSLSVYISAQPILLIADPPVAYSLASHQEIVFGNEGYRVEGSQLKKKVTITLETAYAVMRQSLVTLEHPRMLLSSVVSALYTHKKNYLFPKLLHICRCFKLEKNKSAPSFVSPTYINLNFQVSYLRLSNNNECKYILLAHPVCFVGWRRRLFYPIPFSGWKAIFFF